MKPSDLKVVVPWQERRPYIADRILHVPKYYHSHHEFQFPGWQDASLFGNANPVCVEYCAGNGDWIVEKARSHPCRNWVAVEKQFDRVRKIWSKLKNTNLFNLIVVCGEAMTFTHHYLAEASIEEVFINFPDPWPKTKHQKHRLMNTSFIKELYRVLQPEKQVTFVTDDSNYLASTVNAFVSHSPFKPLFPLPHFTACPPEYGASWFESLWREQGRLIYYTQFGKQ